MATPQAERVERVWRVVADTPAGCVATYGQVAELAGLPGGARQVGERQLARLRAEVVALAAGKVDPPRYRVARCGALAASRITRSCWREPWRMARRRGSRRVRQAAPGISEWPSSRVRALGPEWTFDMDAARRAYTWLLSRRTHRRST